jgi:hypothetical protein
LHEVLLFSPTPEDLLTRVNLAAGRTVYPGVVALVLAVLALVALVRRRPPTGVRRRLWVFPPLMVAGVIVSLGPRLAALPLFEVAFRLVPSWNFIRQPAKAQVLAALGLAVLAGVGTDALAARGGRALRGAMAALLGLLVAVEYHPGGRRASAASPLECQIATFMRLTRTRKGCAGSDDSGILRPRLFRRHAGDPDTPSRPLSRSALSHHGTLPWLARACHSRAGGESMRPHGPCAPLRAVLLPALLLLLVAGCTTATNPRTTSATAAAPTNLSSRTHRRTSAK